MNTRSYLSRLIDDRLSELLAQLPALLITGPRATGKTTTGRRHAAAVVRLDREAEAAAFRADPDAVLREVVRKGWRHVRGGSPRKRARSGAQQRLEAGGCKLPRAAAHDTDTPSTRGPYRANPNSAVLRAALEEGLRILAPLLRREQVSYQGDYFRVEGATINPPAVQQPHVPLLIAGGGEKTTLRFAAQYARCDKPGRPRSGWAASSAPTMSGKCLLSVNA